MGGFTSRILGVIILCNQHLPNDGSLSVLLSHCEEPFGYAQDKLRDAAISCNGLYYKVSRLLR